MNPEKIVVFLLIFSIVTKYIADQKLWIAVRKKSFKITQIIGNSVQIFC